MRAWLLTRDGADWVKATYSVVLDRLIGILALAILVAICSPWTLRLVHNPVGRSAVMAISLGGILVALAFVALSFARWELLERWRITRHLKQLAVTTRRTLLSSAVGLALIALSLLVHVLSALAAWYVALATHAPLTFVHAVLLVPPVLLIAAIPVSIAGWGVRESALVLAFSYAGLPEASGLVISLLLGVMMFAIGLIGGALWIGTTSRPAAD
jgi:uncharacterized membrane protein YbhN (UPF0104 family)